MNPWVFSSVFAFKLFRPGNFSAAKLGPPNKKKKPFSDMHSVKLITIYLMQKEMETQGG
jgi:hypothetical protein